MKEETSAHHFTETYNCDCQLTFPSYHHLSAHNLQTHQRKIKSLQALFSIHQCKYKISAFEPSLELHLPSLKDTLQLEITPNPSLITLPNTSMAIESSTALNEPGQHTKKQRRRAPDGRGRKKSGSIKWIIKFEYLVMDKAHLPQLHFRSMCLGKERTTLTKSILKYINGWKVVVDESLSVQAIKQIRNSLLIMNLLSLAQKVYLAKLFLSRLMPSMYIQFINDFLTNFAPLLRQNWHCMRWARNNQADAILNAPLIYEEINKFMNFLREENEEDVSNCWPSDFFKETLTLKFKRQPQQIIID